MRNQKSSCCQKIKNTRHIKVSYIYPNSSVKCFNLNSANFFTHQHCYPTLHTPSASLAISCRRPVVPKSIPVRSSSSLSKNELALEASVRSVTCPTFIGLPASSNPLSCSNAFLAHSESENCRLEKHKFSNTYRQDSATVLLYVISTITQIGETLKIKQQQANVNVLGIFYLNQTHAYFGI